MGTETKNGSTVNTTEQPRVLRISTSVGCCNSPSSREFEVVCKEASVPSLPIYIDENDVIKGAKDILRIIRPHWDIGAVQFKKFTDGITNKLVGCFYMHNRKTALSYDNINRSSSENHGFTNRLSRPDEYNDSGNLSDDSDFGSQVTKSNKIPVGTQLSNAVLVRVYGNKTDLLIDRKAETKNMILLHSYGFAPALYATFRNGLAYDFVPGVTLNPTSVLRSEIWRLVAHRMAEMHRVVKVETNNGEELVPMLWRKIQSFFNLVPERFSDAVKHNRLASTFPPLQGLREEFENLYKHLASLGSPLVFAHNDLLLRNVIYTESLQCVNFIDFEYADYNFQAFDIGNHFAEFAGVDAVDYGRYPEREFQYNWLRVYLQTYMQRKDISDAELHRLYVQVNKFALAAHFFWTIWSLIQAEHSTIDFDYVDYAFVRYKEYLTKKDMFMTLDAALLS